MNKHELDELTYRARDAGMTPAQLIAEGTKARRGGSRYMDGYGYLRKDSSSVKDIRRAERWLKEIMGRGATVPEAWWEILNTFQVAMENVRFVRVRGAKLARDAKKKTKTKNHGR